MGKVVLLVDDDEGNCELVQFVVARSRLDIELIVAVNGQEGVDAVKKRRPGPDSHGYANACHGWLYGSVRYQRRSPVLFNPDHCVYRSSASGRYRTYSGPRLCRALYKTDGSGRTADHNFKNIQVLDVLEDTRLLDGKNKLAGKE